jgi:hypothetical protein
MVKPMGPDEEQRLAERLKREAEAARPAFSEALHARICQALKRCEAAAQPRAVTPWWRSVWLPVAIAAALLASVPLAAWWLNRPFGPGGGPAERGALPTEITGPAADPDMITGPTARTAEHVGLLVESTVSAGQWAYLDHDARLAIQLLVDQLPLDVASLD